MKLRDIFSAEADIAAPAADLTIGGLAVDSRAVKPGDLFFALAGAKTDGARFVAAAVAAGVANDAKADWRRPSA